MLKSLIKIRFLSVFSTMSRQAKTKKDTGVMFGFVIAAIIALAAAFFFTVLSLALAPVLISARADWLYFLLFMIADVSIVFIFGIFETKSEIFECKDNELLLSMPLPPSVIVFSRILSVIIWNYIESALIFLPVIVVYAICGGSALGIVGGALVFLFLPLLPTSLSALIGYAVSWISSKLRRKTLVSVVFFLLFFGAYMYAYTYLVSGMDSFLTDGSVMLETFGRFAFLRSLGGAAMLEPVPLILICLSSVLSVLLTVSVISLCFSRIVSAKKGGKRVVYKAKDRACRSPKAALISKELSRFFSSATYILNTSLGLIFMVVLAVGVLVMRDDIALYAASVAQLLGADSAGLTCIFLASAHATCVSFTYISACSLSLEGRNISLLKSLPISGTDVLISKMLLHVVICAPPVFVTSVLLMIASGEYVYFWYFLLLPQALNLLGAVLGIIYNTLFPKFEFSNETAVIKNSASVALTMFTMLLLALIISGVGLLLCIKLGALAASLLQLLFCFLLCGILFAVLKGSIVRRYERI